MWARAEVRAHALETVAESWRAEVERLEALLAAELRKDPVPFVPERLREVDR
jgi:hypothetical protein